MNKKIFVYLISFGVVFVALSVIFLFQKKLINDDYIFEISPGSSISSIIDDLSQQNILPYKIPYLILVKIEHKLFQNLDFKSGEYLITKDDNFLSLKHKFQNHNIHLRKITFIEGDTTKDFLNIIDESPYLSGTISLTPTEGTLFPDTYYFEKNTSKDELISRMQTKTAELLNEFWLEYHKNISLKSKEEVLIMASIIEKETGQTSERGIVSGVFYNRLAKRMRLQSDPTVIYAITKGQYKLERPLSKKDLMLNSPFNTYRTSGLPPTPIANPGYAAIYAAFNPEETNYLYFVSDGKGGHNFSTNLSAHNKNVAILRKIEQANKNAQKN